MGTAEIAPYTNSSTVINSQWERLCSLLATASPRSRIVDEFEWCSNSSGFFYVASVSALVSNLKSWAWHPQTVSMLKILWKMLIPLKIQFFSWRLFTSRLPTKDLLLLRGVV